jgi:dihydrofolate reductase
MAAVRPIPLTLIVATSPNLGIGLRGALPWRLRSELRYFARVTTRVPPADDPDSDADDDSAAAEERKKLPPPVYNAVIMGRRTWESIPARFRPLPNRVNIVLTRSLDWRAPPSAAGVAAERSDDHLPPASLFTMGNLASARRHIANMDYLSRGRRVARAFVIGGADAYRAALEADVAERVLVTKVAGEWECDTFFPVDLDASDRWRRCSVEEWARYTGEPVEGVKGKEGDTEWEYVMYRRNRG